MSAHARLPSITHVRASRATARSTTTRTIVRARADAIGVLYDVPVSNNGARCRILARWLNLYEKLELVDPTSAFDGGIKGADFAAINPQMKMPALALADGSMTLGESEVINQYLLDSPAGRKFLETRGTTPESRATGALATRTHDLYIGPIQGAMYRGPMDRATRAAQVKELKRQLDELERLAGRVEGAFICGDEPTSADAAVFPTLIFCEFLLPTYFGWTEAFGPNLRRMYEAMMADEAGRTTANEVLGGLKAWAAAGRFEKVGVVEDVADDAYRWAY